MTCAVLVSPLQTSGREAVKHRAGFHGSGDGGRPAREVMRQIGAWSSEEAMADTAGRGMNVAKVMVVDCKSISPESPRLHPNSLRLENTRHPSGSGRSPP